MLIGGKRHYIDTQTCFQLRSGRDGPYNHVCAFKDYHVLPLAIEMVLYCWGLTVVLLQRCTVI